MPENLELKIKVWTGIDRLVDNDKVILATSTSCILPSKICETLQHREQFIVAHPVECNPYYYILDFDPFYCNTICYPLIFL